VAQIINYYTYGSGEASEKGVFGKSWCGPSGSWAYFICKNNINAPTIKVAIEIII